MYRKFMLPRRIIRRQSLYNGSKHKVEYSKYNSQLSVTGKCSKRLFSSGVDDKFEIDSLVDKELDKYVKEANVENLGNGRVERKRAHMEINKCIVFEEISEGDPEKLNRLKKLDLELGLLKEEMLTFPFYLTKGHYKSLLEMSSLPMRKSFLSGLFSSQALVLKKKRAEDILKKKRLQIYEEAVENDCQIYSMPCNSLFTKFKGKILRKIGYERLFIALLHSPHVVFDISFEKHMSGVMHKNCALQILKSISVSMLHQAPCHVKVCNLPKNSKIREFFSKIDYGIEENFHPWEFQEENYLDFYDHHRLVYLTSYANNELKKYDPNDVYIMGPLINKGILERLLTDHARKYNLRMAKFPIDTYLHWKVRSRVLELHIALSVLLDFRLYGDWNIAFKNIPKEKIFTLHLE